MLRSVSVQLPVESRFVIRLKRIFLCLRLWVATSTSKVPTSTSKVSPGRDA